MATREEYIAKANKARDLGDTELEMAFLQKAKAASAQPTQQAENFDTKSYANMASRYVKGALDPFISTGRFAINSLGAISPEGSFPTRWASKSNEQIDKFNRRMDIAKEKENVGTDVAGFLGTMTSPINALGLLSKVPVSTAGKALQGFGIGAVSGIAQPTEPGEDYWPSVAKQGFFGGMFGSALAGLSSGISERIARKMAQTPADELAAQAATHTDEAVNAAVKDLGAAGDNIPPQIIEDIKRQVFDGFKKGEKIDAAAALRNIDFEKIGIKPLQGQITRDPLLYSREKNLRGAIPEIAVHLQSQEKTLRDTISGLAGVPAERYQAGKKSIDVLKNYINEKTGKISGLYDEAKQSVGKDYVIPTEQLFNDIASIKNEYRGAIPKGLLKTLDEYQSGMVRGAERVPKPFTFEEADHFLKQVNQTSYGARTPERAASRAIKKAVTKAMEQETDIANPYAPAVKAAGEFIRERKSVPAVGAVYNEAITPDKFTTKFILNGDTDQVKGVAAILKQRDPLAFEEAKYQIGSEIEKALVGQNVVGDAATSGNSLAKVLKKYGNEKLSAFYTPQEIETLHRISRVSGYINTPPAANVQNFSNTTVSALAELPRQGLLAHLGPVGRLVEGVAKAGTGAVKNQMAAAQAFNSQVPISQLPMTYEQRRLLNLISILPPIAGSAAASNIMNQ